MTDDPVEEVGTRFAVVDSDGQRVAVIEMPDHEKFWHSKEVHDDTLVVTRRFRLLS